ncbi:hypothetical protein SSX86_025468 [Deinandra increscens subsp. villosa]|uniref:Cytochrome P450 n=1 Tax=Deinandra increscens subsp. villosa TaxID=3103831 RepID=A0AAP0GP38_9ASTR
MMISNMLLPYLFLLSLTLLYFFYILPKFIKNKSKSSPPPGPPGLPFIGNLHQIDQSTLHIFLWNLTKRYGPIVSLRFGFNSVVVVSSPSLAKEVMKTQDLLFCDRPLTFSGQRKLTYDGLDIAFSPYGEQWKKMRKIFSHHLFSPKRVQSLSYIREDEVERTMKMIHDLALSSKEVNLSEMIKNVTIDITVRVNFGKRYQEVSGLLDEIQACLVDQHVSDIWPGLPFTRLVDRLLGKTDRLEKCFQELDSFYQQQIDERLNNDQKHKLHQANEEEGDDDDVIDILLQLAKDELFTITHKEIRAMLMDVLIAGTDTSAASVIWAMTSLIKNPKVMKKAQEEVRNVIGKNGKIREGDHLPKLTYLKAVIKETMRLYPPTPLLVPRETRQDAILNGFKIKKKTLVFVNAWAMGRDPKSWENPEEFLPERFLGGCDIDFKGNDFELTPFGAGRRICPGMSTGVATVELLLANLLYSFDWGLPDDVRTEDINYGTNAGITMHKKDELSLRAHVYV